MTTPASTLLTPWTSYYEMTGTAAAALIGLMFVVITLVTGSERMRRSHEGTANYSTPTVVHFGAALLVSALLCAPWHALSYPGAILTLAGVFGIGYVLLTAYRIRRMEAYTPDAEDWIWHTVLPLLGYASIVVGGVTLPIHAAPALFGPAAAAVLMIFIGIHNAWDIVTYITVDSADASDESEPS